MLRQFISKIVQNNNFLTKFAYLMDSDDRRNFVKFLVIIFIGGLLSLMGIGAVIPFAHLLIDPKSLTQLPVIGELSYIQAVGICVAALILAYWIKDFAAFLILRKQSVFLNHLAAKVQRKLFCCYIYSPFHAHVNRSSPELVSNINVEVSQLTNQLISQMGNLINECITSSIVFIFLLFVNPVFALAVVGGVLLAARLFIIKLRHKGRYYGQLRAKSYARLTQAVWQGLGGLKETKIYHRENFFVDKVDHYAEQIAFSGAFSQVFQQSPRYLVEAVAITIVMGLLFIFILLGYSGQMALVLLTVFGVAAVQLLPSLNRLMSAITSIKYGMPALDKVYNELSYYDAMNPDSVKQIESRQQTIDFKEQLQLDNISFAYQDKTVLQDVSLTIPKGQRVAFVGPSGAGKTTLVDIILGVLQPKQGCMLVGDTEITDDNIAAWQRHFGYIPQMIYIYDCSLRENIAFGLESHEIDDDQVWQVLNQAALSSFVQQECPDGLDTHVGENGIRLSGGQRQRIGIARALYHNPDILVMDEATAALDNETEKLVTQALSNIEKDRTIITIAHRLTTIQNYDKICVMRQGQLVDTGDYKTLYDNCEMFRQMADAGLE